MGTAGPARIAVADQGPAWSERMLLLIQSGLEIYATNYRI